MKHGELYSIVTGQKRKNSGEMIQSIICLVLVNIDISFQLKFEGLHARCTLKN